MRVHRPDDRERRRTQTAAEDFTALVKSHDDPARGRGRGGPTARGASPTASPLPPPARPGPPRRIFYPMLAGYARGEFQGFCADGRSRDWRDWHGGCHGYEGLLVDNYHALLAVLDDVKAKR